MDVLYQLLVFFGLNYQPTNFSELFTWFVLVIFLLSIVLGVIKLMIRSSFSLARSSLK